jgi:hypothetical protein
VAYGVKQKQINKNSKEIKIYGGAGTPILKI